MTLSLDTLRQLRDSLPTLPWAHLRGRAVLLVTSQASDALLGDLQVDDQGRLSIALHPRIYRIIKRLDEGPWPLPDREIAAMLLHARLQVLAPQEV